MEDLKEKWRKKGHLDRNYPEEHIDEVIEKYEAIEKWEKKYRKDNDCINEQFYADLYAIASIMTREDSFKGKFKPEELYEEIKATLNTVRKGQPDYSLSDEVKVVGMVMDAHRKKTSPKK